MNAETLLPPASPPSSISFSSCSPALTPLSTQLLPTPSHNSFPCTTFQKNRGEGASRLSPSATQLRLQAHSFHQLAHTFRHHGVGVPWYPQLDRTLSPLGHPPATAAPARIFGGHASHGFRDARTSPTPKPTSLFAIHDSRASRNTGHRLFTDRSQATSPTIFRPHDSLFTTHYSLPSSSSTINSHEPH